MKRPLWRWTLVATLGLVLGALVWACSSWATGSREPFDGSWVYYGLTTFLAGALSAAPSPRHWWLAVISVFLGQHLYAFAAYPDLREWFLFGIVVNALIPTWVFAAVGAFAVFLVSRLLDRSRSGATPQEEES